MAQENFVGRKEELDKLNMLLKAAGSSQGNAVLVKGQPGIGKTSLVENFCDSVSDFQIFRGSTSQELPRPFLMFSDAMSELTDAPLFEEQEHVSFTQLFAINHSGLLIAKASREEDELDADIFAGMLTAVQSFVRDSFGTASGSSTGLGRLEYGSMKIMIEHSQHMFLVAVLKEKEHPDMAISLRSFLKILEDNHGHILENWNGSAKLVMPIQQAMEENLGTRFLVRKVLEGLKIEAECLRIAENVLEILDSISRESPVLLILEDLQWADDNSMIVFRHLARNLDHKKILVLATSRPGNERLEKSFSDMETDDILQILALEKLEVQDARELLDKLYNPNNIPQDFLMRLEEQCNGNPFFLRELLAQMSSEGAITRQEGTFVLKREDYEIPSSIEEVLDMRLARLGSEELALVEFASCFGRDFPVNMVQDIQTVADPIAALNGLQTAGIINRNNGSAMFSHALFQDVVYRNMSQRWRTIHHLQIGNMYEAGFIGRLDQVIFELARHYSHTREHQKATKYSIKAAEKAEASYAIDQAVELYRQAIIAMGKLGGKAESGKPAELLERLADSLLLAEKIDESLETYMKSYELVENKEDKSRLRRKRSIVLEMKSEFDLALEESKLAESEAEPESLECWLAVHRQSKVFSIKGMNQESLATALECKKHIESIGNNEGELADVEHSLGVCYWHMGDYDLSLEHLNRALEARKRIGDIRKVAGSYGVVAILHCEKGELDRGIDIQKMGLQIDLDTKNIRGVARAYGNLGVYYQRKGQFQEAYDWTYKGREEFQKVGDKWGLARTDLNLGVMLNEMGDIKGAYELYMGAFEIFTKLGDKHGQGISTFFISASLWEMGDIEESEKWLDNSLEINEEIGEVQRIIGIRGQQAEMMVTRGQHTEAETIQRELLEKGREMKDMEAILSFEIQLADNLIGQGKLEEARKLLNEALNLSRENSIQQFEATAIFELAKLEAASEDIDKAIEHFQAAEVIYKEINAWSQIARLQFSWGKALREAGMDDGGLLEKALAEFEKREMKGYARQVKEILK